MAKSASFNRSKNSRMATVTELSQMAGCSIATVSRVLNNSGAVSDATREAVLKAMRQTQYLAKRTERRSRAVVRSINANPQQGIIEIVQHRHSPVERISVDGDSLAVGPLEKMPEQDRVPRPYQLGVSFYQHLVNGAVDELGKWGFRAQLRLNSDLLDPTLVADMNDRNREGVLLIGEYSKDLGQFMKHCLPPLVLVDILHQGPCDMVTIDNFAGIQAAFRHLYNLGHRRIGFVGRRDEIAAFSERYAAFHMHMAEAGLQVQDQWVYQGPDHIETTTVGVKRILEHAQRPTALICANDCYALGVARAANSLNMTIPHGLSVVGFDDVEFAAMVTPPLTSVRVPL